MAVRLCLQQLSDPKRRCLSDPSELAAIGFKAVHAQGVTGVQRVDERVLAAMEAYADVAPAHNPPYVRAMRLLAKELPQIPLVAAFETGFHETIPPAERLYAVPLEWAEKHGIKRWGFHGASHRYIAGGTAQLLGKPEAKIISCHLGGSSSLCAIKDGKSVANSLGMSPQSGLPHNNRVGDFDVVRPAGADAGHRQDAGAAARRPGQSFGPAGAERRSNDLRDIEAAAATGDAEAQLAHRRVRRRGAALPRGVPAAAERGRRHRVHRRHRRELVRGCGQAVCANLDWFGIHLDPRAEREGQGRDARSMRPTAGCNCGSCRRTRS